MTVKIAKLQGDYDWHNHELEDKFFVVIDRQLIIELNDKTIEVNKGEMVVVPKNTPHKPFEPIEIRVMFLSLTSKGLF